MGFWGKALGVGVGFMFGGPIGAFVGGALGHMYDQEKESQTGGRYSCPHCHQDIYPGQDGHCPSCGMEIGSYKPRSTQDRQFVFYVSLTSLAAKMAKADGVVTADEIAAFDQFVRQELRVNGEERKIIANLFNEAKDSSINTAEVAQQFKDLIGYQPQVLQTMIHLLFRIALADGKFHKAEEQFIRQVAYIFEMGDHEYEQIKAMFIKKADGAYQILGVSPQSSDAEIKSAYKKLVIEYHPDKLIAKGVPEDFIKIANEKMAKINAAYDEIEKERGL